MKKIIWSGYTISLTLTSLLWSPFSAALELPLAPWMTERRIIGPNNLEPVVSQGSFIEFYDLTQVVARLETPDGAGFCTGSRVGQNLFLTNYHCQEVVPCEDIVVHMGYEKGRAKSAQGIFQCEKILAANETYDYALISARWIGTQAEVDSMNSSELTSGEQDTSSDSSALSQGDFPIAPLYAGELSEATSIVVASHPRGRLKEIDRSSDCKILSTEIISISMRETMTHSCDTEGGSSGSPVLSRLHGAIVGLHWGGVSNQNFMIPISSVVSDLKNKITDSDFNELTFRM